MRQILFRGKRVDNGKFIISDSLMQIKGENSCLWVELEGWVKVIPETVGQSIGLCDKNGKNIFEGDIIYIKCGYGLSGFVGNGIVFFDDKRLQFRVVSVEPSSFDSEKGNIYDACDFMVIDGYEVIDNIYDNKEKKNETV